MRLLFCLPTYNEVYSIEKVIRQIQALGYDLICTDGGSTDGTKEKIKALNIHCIDRPGKGKGVGIRLGLEFAYKNKYTHFAYVDCDLTYPIEDFPLLIYAAEGVDMVVGTRHLGSISFLRRMVNIFFNHLIALRWKVEFADVLSGMRILKVESFFNQLQSEEFEIEPEMHCLCLSKKMSIKEVSIPYFKRVGDSKIGAKAFFRILFTILTFRVKE
jgi:glycosyltransferase involved in cell wall biosynthesis